MSFLIRTGSARGPLRPSLRSRLLTFFSLSVAGPALLTGLLAYATVRSSLVASSLREQRELARRLADRVAGHVESTQRGLLTLATQGRLHQVKPRQRLSALRELLANYPDMMEISLYDGSGKGLVRAARRNGRLVWGPDAARRAGRDEFEKAAQGRPYVGPVFFTDRDRIPQMFLSVPTGSGHGVLLARLSLGSMWTQVAEAASPSMQAAVVDREGHLLAHADSARVLGHENWTGRPGVRSFLTAANAPDTASYVWGEEKDRSQVVLQRVPALGWATLVEAPVERVLAPVRRLGARLALIVGALGALFWFIGWTLVDRILHPLRGLEAGLGRIGRGELSHRLDIRTGDELQRVAEALNDMAASLEGLEKIKRDLTHMIVHDLKNPLTGLLGSLDYVTVVAKDNLTPEQKKLLSLGAKSGRELLRLIQNLLDLAKMEEGRLELRREPVSLLELAGQCVDDLEAAILKENKVISVEVDKDLPKAWADRDLIHRVLANLLTNALKHTHVGTEISIHVGVAAERTRLVMSVKDNGDGIPPEFREKIFEKFSQAEGKKQNYRVGSGLGLTFCKMVAEAHGGDIWVDSVPGRGSEFFFSLPVAPRPASAPAADRPASIPGVVSLP